MLVVLAVVYFGIAYIYYNNRFLNGTVINGYECSNMKVEDAFNNIDKDVNSFNLTICKGENVLDVIKGSDIGINTGNTDNQMKEICDKQKKYLWLKYFKEKQEPITTNDMVQYDEEKFNKVGISYEQYLGMYNAFYYDYNHISTEQFEKLDALNTYDNKFNFDLIQFGINYINKLRTYNVFSSLYKMFNLLIHKTILQKLM